MIDYFSLALTHGLILLAVWRILQREELDDERVRSDKAAPPEQSI